MVSVTLLMSLAAALSWLTFFDTSPAVRTAVWVMVLPLAVLLAISWMVAVISSAAETIIWILADVTSMAEETFFIFMLIYSAAAATAWVFSAVFSEFKVICAETEDSSVEDEATVSALRAILPIMACNFSRNRLK